VDVQCYPPSGRDCKAILTYNGEKAVGAVASVSFHGLAVVEFKAEEIKDAVPLRVCNVRPGMVDVGKPGLREMGGALRGLPVPVM
jgi:hypothetical protein